MWHSTLQTQTKYRWATFSLIKSDQHIKWKTTILAPYTTHLTFFALQTVSHWDGSKMHLVCKQTWNLSKNLHRRIFRLKILHCHFNLISTVLVGKNTKKWVKIEKFTPLAKILQSRRHWRHGQIPPLRLSPNFCYSVLLWTFHVTPILYQSKCPASVRTIQIDI